MRVKLWGFSLMPKETNFWEARQVVYLHIRMNTALILEYNDIVIVLLII